ncbi:Hydrogenase maturation protease [hydrothermal vent metagenome]|uniref:Hydrogenase maturation protease n=1 Tax=hydrothermal vent metagenome TaxID=652676 RepID=A0A3B1B6L0_9ZZZZ
MAAEKTNILIIGMGNVLMQDEGIGVRAVEELESRYIIPAGVRVLDGGTAGMELFEPIRNCQQLIVADGVNTGDPFGTVVRIANEDIPVFFQTKISNHQLGLSELLALLQLKAEMPEHVAIIGMVPHSLENKLGLSAQAAAGLDEMISGLVNELAALGVNLQLRDKPLVGHWQNQAELEKLAACV